MKEPRIEGTFRQGLNLAGMRRGVGTQRIKSLRETFDTEEEVLKTFKEEGFHPTPEPSYPCPNLTPEQITNPDPSTFSETYAYLLGWYNYCADLLATVQVGLLQQEHVLEILGAETRHLARQEHEAGAKKHTVEELKDRLLLSPEYKETLLLHQKYEQHKRLLQARLESLDRSLKVISRQVTIRSLDLEATRTGSGLPTRGKYPMSGEQP